VPQLVTGLFQQVLQPQMFWLLVEEEQVELHQTVQAVAAAAVK
jgi:hypothetical protein